LGVGAMACSPLFAMALRINRLHGLLIGYAIFGGLAGVLLFCLHALAPKSTKSRSPPQKQHQ